MEPDPFDVPFQPTPPSYGSPATWSKNPFDEFEAGMCWLRLPSRAAWLHVCFWTWILTPHCCRLTRCSGLERRTTKHQPRVPRARPGHCERVQRHGGQR